MIDLFVEQMGKHLQVFRFPENTSIREMVEHLMSLGVSKWVAKNAVYGAMYGMNGYRIMRIMNSDIAANIASAYRPEGVP